MRWGAQAASPPPLRPHPAAFPARQPPLNCLTRDGRHAGTQCALGQGGPAGDTSGLGTDRGRERHLCSGLQFTWLPPLQPGTSVRPGMLGVQVDAPPASALGGGGSDARRKARAFPSRDCPRWKSAQGLQRGSLIRPRGASLGAEVGAVRPALTLLLLSSFGSLETGLFRKKRPAGSLGFPGGSQSLGCFPAPTKTRAPAGFSAPPVVLTLFQPEPSPIPHQSPLLLLPDPA